MSTAYTPRHRVRVVALAGALPLAIGGTGGGLILSWIPDLPANIATHWGLDGAPNGYETPVATALLVFFLCAAIALAGTVGALSMRDDAAPARGKAIVASAVLLATVLTIGVVVAVALQRHTEAQPDGGAIGLGLLVGVGAGLILGAIAFVLTPSFTRRESAIDDAPPSLALAPTERAAWSRSTAPDVRLVMVLLAVLLVVLATTLTAVLGTAPEDWPFVLLPVGIVALTTSMLFWRVSVTEGAGVVVRSVLGLPRFRIPLADVASARATDVSPVAQFGGWGLRFGGNGFGIVVRSGPGLEVTRSSGRRLTVTVADAETGAALINALAERRKVA